MNGGAMKEFFDAAMALIDRSWHIALGVSTACGAVLAGNVYGIWPLASIEPATLPWIGIVGLVCAGIVFGHLIRWALSLAVKWQAARARRTRLKQSNADIRQAVIYSTADEKALLRWILIRNRDYIECEPYVEPVYGLVRKGVLLSTDRDNVFQVYRMHPAALAMKAALLTDISPERREVLLRINAPLKDRRRRPY